MHAPSVGEGLQARAVLELIRERRPDVQLVYTHYSPSAEQFAATLSVDYCDYLPFDTLGDARATITAMAPTAFVYCKLDLWPNFTRIASMRGIRLGMISATVSPGSTRRGWLARQLLREAYSRLDAVGAVSEEDAARVLELGARPNVVFVTGDTRYDQVAARARGAQMHGALLAPLMSDRPTIVAGSTWPGDEARLLPAFKRLLQKHANAQLIIAPHEPTTANLAGIESWAAKEGVPLARLTSGDPANAAVLLVDRMGVLGELYSLADIAYVGGGLHDAGLHSVLEPAAYGVPVLFGPEFRESRDAVLLLKAKAASSVKDADGLYQSVCSLLGDAGMTRTAGEQAAGVVQQGTGAALKSFELVDALLSS
jgi:3-deoxy-D-manno-octulosonic-acid transferase